MSLGRLLFLIAVFGLMVWYFVVPSLDDPGTRGAAGGPKPTEPVEPEDYEAWTPEEQAVWREQINRRLHSR
jgi:hypothetical protein